MPVTPPTNLDSNAAPWGRHINGVVNAHETRITQLATAQYNQNQQLNASVNLLAVNQRTALNNVYTMAQSDAQNAATLASAQSYTQSYAAPVSHTHPASDIVSGTLTRPIATTTGNFSTSITSIGARNNQVSSGYVAAYIDVNGVLGFAPSVRALKQNIAPYNVDMTKFLNIPIYQYSYKSDPNNTLHVGPMADDFDAAGLKEFVVYDANGAMQGLDDKSLLWGLASAYETSRKSTLTRVANQMYQTQTITGMATLALGGTATYSVTWPNAFVDANYMATASVYNTSGVPIAGPTCSVILGSKTTTKCSVQVTAGVALLAGQTLVVEAIHI